jgi:uncharacterized membrane-anchored protein YitT (DUF2179 family)
MKSIMTLFDLQGLTFGVLMASLGVVFLKSAGLVTGQTAGIALLLSYVLSVGFGPIFFVIGIPFLVLAWFRRGSVFAIRTLFVVAGISACSQFLEQILVFDAIAPWLAAVLGGAAGGMGLVAIFRHNASAGGLTIVGIIIEHATGFRAGRFQLGVDALVFFAAAFVLSFEQLIFSLLGAVITNMAIVWNFDVAQSGTGRPGYGRASVPDDTKK